MEITLNTLIPKFARNIHELRELLKLPEKYKKQAEFARIELDRFFLPLSIQRAIRDLKKKSKDIPKEKIQKYLKEMIAAYKKIEPNKVDKKGNLLVELDEKYFSNFHTIKKQREKLQQSIAHKVHIERAVLFNLICYFEQSFSDISHIVLKQHPEILQLNDKSLTFDEIQKFETLDDAKEYLISQEIEKLLFKPISDFFDFFEKKVFKTEIPDLSKFKNELIEIKERRNLLIHNGGIVNSKYLNTVEKDLQEKYKIKKDSKIILNREYLEECIQKIELIGLETLFTAAMKFQDDEKREQAISEANLIIYDTFAKKEENLFLGENLSLFILDKCQKYLNNEMSDYFQLNYWHILKIQGKISPMKDKIAKYDISSKNPLIKLCYYALIDNYKDACKQIVPSLNFGEKFDINLYEEFPILENLRKQKTAKDIIKKQIEQMKKK